MPTDQIPTIIPTVENIQNAQPTGGANAETLPIKEVIPAVSPQPDPQDNNEPVEGEVVE